MLLYGRICRVELIAAHTVLEHSASSNFASQDDDPTKERFMSFLI